MSLMYLISNPVSGGSFVGSMDRINRNLFITNKLYNFEFDVWSLAYRDYNSDVIRLRRREYDVLNQ